MRSEGLDMCSSESPVSTETAGIKDISSPLKVPSSLTNARVVPSITGADIQPRSRNELFRQNREALGIEPPQLAPVPTIHLSGEQEQNLKAEIVRVWKQHEKCEGQIGQLLYRLCVALHAPGRKDEGFNAWLKSNGIPKATAYRWLRNHAISHGLSLPYPSRVTRKPPDASTSSQVRQGSTPADDPTAGQQASTKYHVVGRESSADDLHQQNPSREALIEMLLAVPGLKALLARAHELLNRPTEMFDPETHETVLLFDDPRAKWTPEHNEEEIQRVSRYHAAIDHVVDTLAGVVSDLRRSKRELAKYEQRLEEGMIQPLVVNIEKQPASSATQEEIPPVPMVVEET